MDLIEEWKKKQKKKNTDNAFHVNNKLPIISLQVLKKCSDFAKHEAIDKVMRVLNNMKEKYTYLVLCNCTCASP